ncbi:MAG: DUF3644 domain-containing protein [Deltaproteobacteria bacterium]|nr:DUF3644 domain-containing protein [Deltaproteobacteria bacterium]
MPPTKKIGLNSRQKRFFEFLKRKERAADRFSTRDIVSATSWKPDSVRTNLSEGHWHRIIAKEGRDLFRALGVLKLTEREFHARISQSKRVQSFAYGLANPLAGSLISRSRDNMLLALELYNRPSLANRLDGFVTLFCAAWEQLLKAQLIERDGEDSIFRKEKQGQVRRSISLAECISRVFSSPSPMRRNLEEISDLRDRAVHLLVPQLQPIAARLFQAGVFNFARYFRGFAGEPFIPPSSVGLLTLVLDADESTVINLRAAYGLKTGEEVQNLIDRLSKCIDSETSWEYAIPISYHLVFSDKGGLADFSLTKIAQDAVDSRPLAVIEKVRDREHTHPYLPNKAAQMVDQNLRSELTTTQLERRLVARVGGSPAFILHDFQAIVAKEGWRNSNNEFHHHLKDVRRRWYSQRAIDTAVERICKDEDFLRNARESYSTNAKKTRVERSSL